MSFDASLSLSWRVLMRQPFKVARRSLIDTFEREYLRRLLAAHRGSLSATARHAELDRKHLRRLVRKHGLVAGAATVTWAESGEARATSG